MANSSEQQDYIHWMEISESLGVDVSREIEYYFNGVVDLGGTPPLSDDIQTEVSVAARQLAQAARDSNISQPAASKAEAVRSSTILKEPTRQSTTKNPHSTKAAQNTVSKDKNDEKRTEPDDDSSNVLGLDWSASPSVESKAKFDESVTKEIPKFEKQLEKKQVVAERKPVSPKPVSERQEVDLLGWGTDVTQTSPPKTSEIDAAGPLAAEKKRESRPERNIEKPKPKTREPVEVSLPESDDVREDGFGVGLIDPSIASRPPVRETPRATASRDVPRKPVREAKAEKPDQADPLGFFESDSNEPKKWELSTDDTDFDSLDDDLIEEMEEPVLERAWDEDFVEFEIEDLDPNAGRPPRKRDRDSRDARPAKVEKPVRRDPPPMDDDSVELDGELESPASKDTRSDNSEREGATRTSTRSSRRRKSRGRRKQGENPVGDNPNASQSPEPAPRSKKPDSRPRPRPVDNPDDGFDDDDNDFESTSSGDESRSSKTRNLPTWNETVDVIVQSNIASRKKQPPRRRRGGSGGGPNRQR